MHIRLMSAMGRKRTLVRCETGKASALVLSFKAVDFSRAQRFANALCS
jgi:hypothetical protein